MKTVHKDLRWIHRIALIALLAGAVACGSDSTGGTVVDSAGDGGFDTPDGATDTSIADCSDLDDCSEGDLCEEGQCPSTVCTPNEPVGCEEGLLLMCNAQGTEVQPVRCPSGQGCIVDECQPILPNVLLLVDTSSSMNWTPDGVEPDECGSQCWPWSYPSCDNDPAGPATRLGRVKQVLTDILASESAANVRLALQRFPQHIFTAQPPDCDGGYWTGTSQIQGDEDFHSLSKTWLEPRLWEIVLEPFPASGETDPAVLSRWFDQQEQLVQTSTTCSDNEACNGTPCLNGLCHAFENPEVWGMGLTPFGKSLFYAGEYMRHFVLVEGRNCETTADCASANYTCEDGKCHDPFHHCRPSVIIAFTDGLETEHFYTDDFFHPRVQAKRLHYGLGCDNDGDCGGGATCEDNICRPPPGRIDETQLVCDASDVPCTVNEDCEAFRCLPARLDFVDPTGEDHLSDAAGNFISLTVHVVDASNIPDANNLVAAYGGGRHFSVDLADPTAVLQIYLALLGDVKQSFSCVPL